MQEHIDEEVVYYYDWHSTEDDLLGQSSPHSRLAHNLVEVLRWHLREHLHAVHHNPIHARVMPPALRAVTRHSLLTYGTRHWPGWQVRLLAIIIFVESWARRLWAWWRKDQASADIFRALTALVKGLEAAR